MITDTERKACSMNDRRYLFLTILVPIIIAACEPTQPILPTDASIETQPPQGELDTPLLQEPDDGWHLASTIEGPVYSLDWSPDGRWIASAGWGQVVVWDTADGGVKQVLDEPESYVWSVAWSPDGNYLAAAGVDGVVRIWSAPDLVLEHRFGTRWVFCVSWSPEGDRLAVGYQGGDIEVIDWRTGEVLSRMRVGSLVISLDWSEDGQRLASGNLSGEVSIWVAASGEELVSFSDYTQARSDANGIAWAPDGILLASAHQDGNVRLWDTAEGEMLAELEGHAGWVRGLAWSADGLLLASSGFDSNVIVWRVQTGEILFTFDDQSMPVWAVTWAPDQQSVASGSGFYDTTDLNGEIWVWEIDPP